MSWWYPYKIVPRGTITFSVPDDSREPMESETKPAGMWWGPFHCKECAISCGSFGKTEEQALAGNHGTDDERFFQFFSMQG